jgi:hypothetical protein
MSPHQVADILLMSSLTLFVTSIGFAIAWVRARERATRAESFMEGIRAVQSPQQGVSPALDAIAVEVERIGEGQRFLTKVLSEQQPARVAPYKPVVGSITPH